MENIITGVPQSVENAAVLLAVSAWHLYPDMAVLGSTTTNIKQKNHLVCSGGIITLGLSHKMKGDEFGISWSLPLSHLRYYGKPVQATRSISSSSSRVSMEELLLVSFGCVTSGWTQHAESNSQCARLLLAIRNALRAAQQLVSSSPWCDLLSEIASKYLGYVGPAKDEADALIAFGRRRCQSFLSTRRKPIPLAFNICQPEVFVELLKGTEPKIAWLRERFYRMKEDHQKAGLDFTDGLILYSPKEFEYNSLLPTAIFTDETHFHANHPDALIQTYPFEEVDEWASLFPVFKDKHGRSSHRRWLPGFPDFISPPHPKSGSPSPQYHSIATCAAERSFDIEYTTGEPCSIFLDDPRQMKLEGEEALWSQFQNHKMIWTISPQNNVSVRPLQGSFLDASPIPQVSAPVQTGDHPVSDRQGSFSTSSPVPPQSLQILSGNHPVSNSPDQCWPQHHRSVHFHQSGSGLQGMSCRPLPDKRGTSHTLQGKVFGAWNTLVGPIMLFVSISQGQNLLLTQEVERISEICNAELHKLYGAGGGTEGTENGATKEMENGTTEEMDKGATEHMSPNQWSCDKSDYHCLNGWYLRSDLQGSKESFTKVFGHMGSIEIYVPSRHLDSGLVPDAPLIEFPEYPALADSQITQWNSAKFSDLYIDEIIEALDSGLIDGTALAQYLMNRHSKFWNSDYQKHIESLDALCSAAKVYSNIPDATVDLSITGKPFHDY
jgi:hypothetical protein